MHASSAGGFGMRTDGMHVHALRCKKLGTLDLRIHCKWSAWHDRRRVTHTPGDASANDHVDVKSRQSHASRTCRTYGMFVIDTLMSHPITTRLT